MLTKEGTPVKSTIINEFVALYQQLNKDNLVRLAEVYDADIEFIDALHHVQGLGQLEHYFAGLYQSLSQCHFAIEQVIEQDGQASLFWLMTYCHPKLNGGKPVRVNGASHLKFNEKIYYHRDYVDLGEMLYEHIPLLGSCIRQVKRRATR
ncbi:nuclear transport factor 2 family protein [Motilimonas eburnea]|nr:nuclear transport factor 2 family protein [Motilimonas eburnea]